VREKKERKKEGRNEERRGRRRRGEEETLASQKILGGWQRGCLPIITW
jgi:hypothetical protein